MLHGRFVVVCHGAKDALLAVYLVNEQTVIFGVAKARVLHALLLTLVFEKRLLELVVERGFDAL
jgi:hypothetical protein